MMRKLFTPALPLLLVSQSLISQNIELWGLTYAGGTYGYGALFSFHPNDRSYYNLYSFAADGIAPYGSLIQATNGLLYGMASNGGVNGGGVIFSYNPSTNGYANVYSFGADSSSGALPQGSLVQASNGLFYGVTEGGGVRGAGVIFSYNPSTNGYTSLYSFVADSISGGYPNGNLVQATNGLLYGMTSGGGVNNAGVIFSLDTSSHLYTNLYSFKTDSNGGTYPEGSLVQVSDSLLYGMTSQGGTRGNGVIFDFDLSTNRYSCLYNFAKDSNSGGYPNGNLVQATNGLLYGMAVNGGANNFGVIFSFDPSDNQYTNLYNFTGSNGASPFGSLIEASNGLLYGMTSQGADQHGVIFSFAPSTNDYTNLYSFTGDSSSGANPSGNLLVVYSATGINTFTSQPSFTLHPNPSSDNIIIENGPEAIGGILKITDITGREVGTFEVENSVMNIPVSGLSPGVYMVLLQAGGEISVRKMVKE